MRSSGLVAAAAIAWLTACGDSGGEFPGCGSDADCKGDRICVQGQCMDPTGTPSGGSGGTGTGSSGTGSGSGGAPDDAGLPGTGGTSGSGGGTGGSPSTPVDDPDLEAACIADCEAKAAAGCEMGFVSVDQCTGQCLIVDEINGGYCNDAQGAQYACLASGGYTCFMGYPQPKSTCLVEAQALATCNQELPCRRYCEVAADTTCGPVAASCFDACRAEEQGFEDFVCTYDFDRLLACWAEDFACDGSARSIVGCEQPAASVADCIGLRQNECEGFCWAAELLGCGSADCVSTCTPKLDDVACGYLYRRLLECTWDSGTTLSLGCVDGVPTIGTACDEDAMMYDTCVTP